MLQKLVKILERCRLLHMDRLNRANKRNADLETDMWHFVPNQHKTTTTLTAAGSMDR